MSNRPKSNSERETIIRRAADEQSWHVFSEDPRVIRRITKRLGAGQAKGDGMVWTLPPTAISFRKPTILDAAAKAARAEKLKKVRNG